MQIKQYLDNFQCWWSQSISNWNFTEIVRFFFRAFRSRKVFPIITLNQWAAASNKQTNLPNNNNNKEKKNVFVCWKKRRKIETEVANKTPSQTLSYAHSLLREEKKTFLLSFPPPNKKFLPFLLFLSKYKKNTQSPFMWRKVSSVRGIFYLSVLHQFFTNILFFVL